MGDLGHRHQYALTHPLSRADGSPSSLAPYRATRKHATGLLLLTILAVDR